MQADIQILLRAVWDSLFEPAPMARQVKSMSFDMNTLWSALVVLAIINVLVLSAVQATTPQPEQAAGGLQLRQLSPFLFAAIVVAALAGTALALWKAGQFLYGTGDLQQTLTIFVWFQTIRLVLLIVQAVVAIISPAAGLMLGLVITVAAFRCFLHFVNELHAFNSLLKAFGCMVLAMLAVAAIGLILLTIVGVQLVGGTL